MPWLPLVMLRENEQVAVHARLRFSSDADRAAARAAIASFAGQRPRGHPDIDIDQPRRIFEPAGPLNLSVGIWMMHGGDGDGVYETIAAMTTPLPGSRVYSHHCQHATGGPCVIEREKVW